MSNAVTPEQIAARIERLPVSPWHLKLRVVMGIALFFDAFDALAIAATWVVPTLGWQWMFYIGAVPAVIALVLRRLLPESPRWLASRGRLEEADRTLRTIEDEVSRTSGKSLPPLPADIPPI